jgi:hypothetical protein
LSKIITQKKKKSWYGASAFADFLTDSFIGPSRTRAGTQMSCAPQAMEFWIASLRSQ